MKITNAFNRGPESWCSYDYHASVVSGGQNVFVLAVWAPSGGVDGSGYIWTDHTRWSADTPERPLSILPLLFYRGWANAEPVDLRGATVSVYLRGDGLELDGARCCFWVHGASTRWHYTSTPLEIPQGSWAAEPSRFELTPDPSLWHMSWAGAPEGPASLEELLGGVVSYGFSFTGFSREVTGRLCMDDFEIDLPG
jgi:hypothetical protein